MKDKGICVLHTIGSVILPNHNHGFNVIFFQMVKFRDKRMAKNIEKSGLIMSDRETLIRMHYDKTLEAWLNRFLKNKHIVKNYLIKNLLECLNFI